MSNNPDTDKLERPHVFTGRVVNGTAICKFCSATPLEAAYALGPTCLQPADERDLIIEQQAAEVVRLRKEVAKFEDADHQRKEQGEREWEYYRATTCPCMAAEQYVEDCPKHGRASLSEKQP
jgi:hypothetical protein